MSTSKKRYDAEFKREAVRLADNSEKGDSAIERELGFRLFWLVFLVI